MLSQLKEAFKRIDHANTQIVRTLIAEEEKDADECERLRQKQKDLAERFAAARQEQASRMDRTSALRSNAFDTDEGELPPSRTNSMHLKSQSVLDMTGTTMLTSNESMRSLKDDLTEKANSLFAAFSALAAANVRSADPAKSTNMLAHSKSFSRLTGITEASLLERHDSVATVDSHLSDGMHSEVIVAKPRDGIIELDHGIQVEIPSATAESKLSTGHARPRRLSAFSSSAQKDGATVIPTLQLPSIETEVSSASLLPAVTVSDEAKKRETVATPRRSKGRRGSAGGRAPGGEPSAGLLKVPGSAEYIMPDSSGSTMSAKFSFSASSSLQVPGGGARSHWRRLSRTVEENSVASHNAAGKLIGVTKGYVNATVQLRQGLESALRSRGGNDAASIPMSADLLKLQVMLEEHDVKLSPRSLLKAVEAIETQGGRLDSETVALRLRDMLAQEIENARERSVLLLRKYIKDRDVARRRGDKAAFAKYSKLVQSTASSLQPLEWPDRIDEENTGMLLKDVHAYSLYCANNKVTLIIRDIAQGAATAYEGVHRLPAEYNDATGMPLFEKIKHMNIAEALSLSTHTCNFAGKSISIGLKSSPYIAIQGYIPLDPQLSKLVAAQRQSNVAAEQSVLSSPSAQGTKRSVRDGFAKLAKIRQEAAMMMQKYEADTAMEFERSDQRFAALYAEFKEAVIYARDKRAVSLRYQEMLNDNRFLGTTTLRSVDTNDLMYYLIRDVPSVEGDTAPSRHEVARDISHEPYFVTVSSNDDGDVDRNSFNLQFEGSLSLPSPNVTKTQIPQYSKADFLSAPPTKHAPSRRRVSFAGGSLPSSNISLELPPSPSSSQAQSPRPKTRPRRRSVVDSSRPAVSPRMGLYEGDRRASVVTSTPNIDASNPETPGVLNGIPIGQVRLFNVESGIYENDTDTVVAKLIDQGFRLVPVRVATYRKFVVDPVTDRLKEDKEGATVVVPDYDGLAYCHARFPPTHIIRPALSDERNIQIMVQHYLQEDARLLRLDNVLGMGLLQEGDESIVNEVRALTDWKQNHGWESNNLHKTQKISDGTYVGFDCHGSMYVFHNATEIFDFYRACWDRGEPLPLNPNWPVELDEEGLPVYSTEVVRPDIQTEITAFRERVEREHDTLWSLEWLDKAYTELYETLPMETPYVQAPGGGYQKNQTHVPYVVEFMRVSKVHDQISPQRVILFRELFNAIDVDGSGHIDPIEMKDALGSHGGIDEAALEELVHEIDADGSGDLSFEEFCHLMSSLMSTSPQGHSTHIALDEAYTPSAQGILQYSDDPIFAEYAALRDELKLQEQLLVLQRIAFLQPLILAEPDQEQLDEVDLDLDNLMLTAGKEADVKEAVKWHRALCTDIVMRLIPQVRERVKARRYKLLKEAFYNLIDQTEVFERKNCSPSALEPVLRAFFWKYIMTDMKTSTADVSYSSLRMRDEKMSAVSLQTIVNRERDRFLGTSQSTSREVLPKSRAVLNQGRAAKTQSPDLLPPVPKRVYPVSPEKPVAHRQRTSLGYKPVTPSSPRSLDPSKQRIEATDRFSDPTPRVKRAVMALRVQRASLSSLGSLPDS